MGKVCRGLGMFGAAVKIERAIARPPKLCKSGRHYISGGNVKVDSHGKVVCRVCHRQRAVRHYWQKQLAQFFERRAA